MAQVHKSISWALHNTGYERFYFAAGLFAFHVFSSSADYFVIVFKYRRSTVNRFDDVNCVQRLMDIRTIASVFCIYANRSERICLYIFISMKFSHSTFVVNIVVAFELFFFTTFGGPWCWIPPLTFGLQGISHKSKFE